MSVKCFWLEPAGRLRRSLRRYAKTEKGVCSPERGVLCYHDAAVPLDVVEDPDPHGFIRGREDDAPPADEPRWPARCQCGYVFNEDDERQVFVERLYRRADTGEEATHRDAGPGAMYDAEWYHGIPGWCGPDGRALIVILPNNMPWHIDGIANNCTDKEGANEGRHKCWVRHGEPPDLTVDKNGVTCNAGAGSILSGDWHGFLRNGFFVVC